MTLDWLFSTGRSGLWEYLRSLKLELGFKRLVHFYRARRSWLLMHGIAKYIAAVRAHADTSAETAYVDRIKIQRSVLKLHRAVAAELGEHRPDTLEARLRDHGGIGSTSNKVATIAALMCQPS